MSPDPDPEPVEQGPLGVPTAAGPVGAGEAVPPVVAASVAGSAVLSTVGVGVQGLARLAYTVLLGRALGTEALGHMSALLSLSIFAALLWPTAAGNTASRFLALAVRRSRPDADVRRVLDISMVVSSTVLAAAAVPVALALGNDLGVALSAGLLVAAYGTYAYARGGSLGHGLVRRVAVWDVLSSALSLGLLVAVLAGQVPVLALVPLSAGYLVFSAVCWPRSRAASGARPSPSVTSEERRDVLGFATWNVLAGVTTNGLLQLAMVAAQVQAPGAGAGVYAAAFTLATPASMLGQAVSQVIVPAFAHGSGAGERGLRGPLAVMGAFGVLTAVLFSAVGVLAPWYLPLFYPAEADAAVPVLQFLMVGVFFFTLALIPSAFLLAEGRSRAVALVSVTGFVVGVAVMAAAGPALGVHAGTLGFLVGSVVNLVAVTGLWSRRRSGRGGPGHDAVRAPGEAL